MTGGAAPRMAHLRRNTNWRARLERVTDAWRRERFELGEIDCAHFAAACICAMTDTDLLEELSVPVYGDQKGALKALRTLGATRSLRQLGDLLFATLPPALAQTGDLALIVNDDAFGSAFAIVLGERLLVVTEHGLDSRERSEAIAAWAVGRPK